MPVGIFPFFKNRDGLWEPTGTLIENDMEPISKEEKEILCAYGRKVIEAKGYTFYRYVYEQGLRDAEKHHGIRVPVYTTRESRRKKDDL